MVNEFLSNLNWLDKSHLTVIEDHFNVLLVKYFMQIIALNVLNLTFGHSFSLDTPIHVFQEDFFEAKDLAIPQLLHLELDNLDVYLHVPS